MIEISKHILEEAYGLLTKQVALPTMHLAHNAAEYNPQH
jgi:hypothetical protein